mgnify:FL=1
MGGGRENWCRAQILLDDPSYTHLPVHRLSQAMSCPAQAPGSGGCRAAVLPRSSVPVQVQSQQSDLEHQRSNDVRGFPCLRHLPGGARTVCPLVADVSASLLLASVPRRTRAVCPVSWQEHHQLPLYAPPNPAYGRPDPTLCRSASTRPAALVMQPSSRASSRSSPLKVTLSVPTSPDLGTPTSKRGPLVRLTALVLAATRWNSHGVPPAGRAQSQPEKAQAFRCRRRREDWQGGAQEGGRQRARTAAVQLLVRPPVPPFSIHAALTESSETEERTRRSSWTSCRPRTRFARCSTPRRASSGGNRFRTIRSRSPRRSWAGQ